MRGFFYTDRFRIRRACECRSQIHASLNQRFSVAKRSFSGQVLCLRRIGEERNHRRPKGRRCLHFGPDHQEGSLSPRRKYLGPPLRGVNAQGARHEKFCGCAPRRRRPPSAAAQVTCFSPRRGLKHVTWAAASSSSSLLATLPPKCSPANLCRRKLLNKLQFPIHAAHRGCPILLHATWTFILYGP